MKVSISGTVGESEGKPLDMVTISVAGDPSVIADTPEAVANAYNKAKAIINKEGEEETSK